MDNYKKVLIEIARVYNEAMNIIHYMHDKYYYEKAQMALVDTNPRINLAYGVAGLSIAIGMGVSLSGGCLDQMTQSIHSALNLSMNLENFQAIINNTFASSPVVLATIFAVILNLILPKEKTTEKETKLR